MGVCAALLFAVQIKMRARMPSEVQPRGIRQLIVAAGLRLILEIFDALLDAICVIDAGSRPATRRARRRVHLKTKSVSESTIGSGLFRPDEVE